MTMGKRIFRLRAAKKLSQEYLAEQLGVSRQAVSKWERDLALPDTGNLVALAALLGVPVEYLTAGETPEQDPFSGPRRALKRLGWGSLILTLILRLWGLLGGAFSRHLLPVFPLIWYGKSTEAILLGCFSLVFGLFGLAALLLARALGKKE